KQLWDSRDEGPRRVLGLDDWIPYWIAYPSAQPSIFFKRSMIDGEQLVDESMNYAFDYDLWLRLAERSHFYPVQSLLSYFRLHPQSKTVGEVEKFGPEVLRASRRYWGAPGSLRYQRYALSRWMWTRSINEAKRAVTLSRSDRAVALRVWLGALLRCPIAPLRNPRPFLSAPYRVV